MLSLSKRTTFDCVFPKGCVRTLLAPMQALSIVSMPPKPLSVHAQVPFDYPGKLRYYSVRASATGQPTKSVQCNPIVEADV